MGFDNDYWKGDEVGYHGLHGYLKRHNPKPENCQFCEKKTNALDLANIDGVYKRDMKHFKYICRSCHNSFDGKVKSLGQYANIKGKCHIANFGKKRNGKYKYTGIFQVKKSKRFHCGFMFKGIKYYVGAFDTQELANNACNRKRQEVIKIYGV